MAYRQIYLIETDSTNEYAKGMPYGQNAIIIAQSQTAGKGTKGRSFCSDKGGIYLSKLTFYDAMPSAQAFKIMVNSCVAVCRTLNYYGFNPVIKWSNDVLVNGKKICGTLIENTLSGNRITRSIVGMGINVNNTLHTSLNGIATTMQLEGNRTYDVQEVISVLLANLEKEYTVEEYKSYINWFEKKVGVILSDGFHVAEACDVTEDGRLVCKIDGKLTTLSSAEVSLKLNV